MKEKTKNKDKKQKQKPIALLCLWLLRYCHPVLVPHLVDSERMLHLFSQAITHTHTHTHTDRLRDRETDRTRERDTETETETEMHTCTHWQTGKQMIEMFLDSDVQL